MTEHEIADHVMNGRVHAKARRTLSPYFIGDPGRAALDVPAGPPHSCPGNADAELSAAGLPGLDIRAATVRGVQRRANRKPRQAAFALGRRSECRQHGQDQRGQDQRGQDQRGQDEHGQHERAIAVVCDGVGTYGSAEEAALLVSRHLVGLAAAGVPWPESFADANKAIGAHVAAALLAGRNAADGCGLATTAAGLVVHRESSHWVGDAAWVGDSSVWHLDGQGEWVLLAGRLAAPGDLAQARSLPSAHGTCTTGHFQVSGGAIFIMTDDVASALQRSAQVRDTLAEWWAWPPDPFTFAAQVAFARRSHTDDRTVVGIWPDTT
jgi:hypothetical protein